MSQLEVTKTRIQRLVDEGLTVRKMFDDLMVVVEARPDKELDPTETQQRDRLATRMDEIDVETEKLLEVLKREEASAATSAAVRRQLAGSDGSGEITPDGTYKYATFASYARDKMIVAHDEIAELAGGKSVRDAAKERLMRAPVHTLSTNVEGLQPEQHFAQILEVIDNSRPVVQSARRIALERGAFTFPHVDQKPEVLLQATQKTEGGTANMQVSMETVTAKSFIGGGNLSWQAVNWSTPDALGLWFDMAAERYARRTEGTACVILTSCGTANRLGTADRIVTGGTATYQDWLSGLVLGFQEVYENSGAMADTLYLSPDMFFLAAALTSDSGAVLVNTGGLTLGNLGGNISGIRVVTSYGFAAATAIVGDSSAFLVAETAGAPVQLRVTEPSIGGYEVGVIGAFAAACYDDNRFSQIT